VQRIGHVRPLGTTRRVRMFEWPDDLVAELEMLCHDAPYELERAYMIVGIEEVARPRRVNLVLERVGWVSAIADERGFAFSISPR
jgi:hypothetical protein